MESTATPPALKNAHPPGPRGLQKIRNAFRYRSDPFGLFEDSHREFGSIAMNAYLGFRFYLVFDPELIEHVLVRNARNYGKDPFLKSWKGIFGEGLLTSEGEHWKRERRMVQPAFHRDRMDGYGRLMAASAAGTFEKWRDGQELALNREMMRLTLDIVVRALFGASLSEGEKARVGEAFDECTRYFEFTGEPMGFLVRNWPIGPVRRYRRAVAELDSIVMGVLRARREHPSDTGDLLSMMLSARDDDGSALSDRQLRDELMTLFLAGHETTALALTYTLFLLATHPEAQRLAQAEVGALGERLAEPADLPRLGYLKQVIQESMRLYPPAWIMGRVAEGDDVLGGYRVPARSIISIPIWAIHRSPRHYEAPAEFRPGRWTEDFQRRLPRAAYLPFGFGPRMCIGATFAMMEMQLVLAELLRRFSVELRSEPRLELQGSITARPRKDVRVALRKRA